MELALEKNEMLTQIFGYLAFVFWSFQLVPQAWKNYRRQTTEGLSMALIVIWYIGTVLISVYAITENFALPLIIQPEVFAVFALVCYLQYMWYDRRVGLASMFLITVGIVIASVGLEYFFVLVLEHTKAEGLTWPTHAMGIIPGILIIAGFIPQLMEIFQAGEQGAEGLSLSFLFIDSLGALFSTLSLFYQSETFDWIAGAMFISVLLIDVFIIITLTVMRFSSRKAHRHANQSLESGCS